MFSLATCHNIGVKFLFPYRGLRGEWIIQSTKQTYPEGTYNTKQRISHDNSWDPPFELYTSINAKAKILAQKMDQSPICSNYRSANPLNLAKISPKFTDPLTYQTPLQNMISQRAKNSYRATGIHTFSTKQYLHRIKNYEHFLNLKYSIQRLKCNDDNNQ